MEIAAGSGTVKADITAFAVLDPVAALPELDQRLPSLVESGELTPSLKLKRNVVMRENKDDVAALYQ